MILPAPNTYEAIGWLVVGLAALCVSVNQIDDFFERRKTPPSHPPAELLESAQLALAERVENLEDDIADLRHEIKADREAHVQAAAIRTAGIYRKIDEVRSELTGNLEKVRHELAENQHRLPNEIVALLKNTNAI